MAQPEDVKTAEYEVTERAGKRVAGRIVPPEKLMTLTEAEAEHGLREGTLVPKGKTLPKVYSEGSKGMDRLRAEAAAFRGRSALPPEETAAPAPAAPAVPARQPDPRQPDPAPAKAAGSGA